MQRARALVAALVVAGAASVPAGPARADDAPPVFTGPRASAPVVLTGAQLPDWSRLPAVAVDDPAPGPATIGKRSAHDAVVTVPPDARTGADPDRVTAFRWGGAGWVEVPVQVDQRMPYALVNGRSSFGLYSGTDGELTYSWAPDAHATGAETWKQVAGTCEARYPTPAETATDPLVTPGVGEVAADWAGPAQDPVPTLDDDDEVAFDARDAGPLAPAGTPAPPGTDAGGHTVTVTDPTTGAVGAVYLFLRDGGSSTTWRTSAVQLRRDADASHWIDKDSFAPSDPEKLGSSNTGYGPNLPGQVCDPGKAPRSSGDRFPKDGQVVETPSYRLTATGRWMVRGYQVTKPGQERAYGPDLIDRWKGRAFQQSPDATVSLVGFEDEQVNWEANSALLGWRSGPVRAMREVWGADSGTNVTKLETYYRDADVFRYHLRVHPIPPDGLYTAWDYDLRTVDRYYPSATSPGVAVDGVDDDTGNIDAVPVPGQPLPYFIDVPDPTFQLPSAVLRPESIAGKGSNGGAVYVFELKSPQAAGNPLVVPYYRDDACLDDGTGDLPVQRPWPGEPSSDQRVRDGYAAEDGRPYDQLRCDPAHGSTPFQGAIGQHGIHFFATGDTDNAFSPAPVTELDGQQWRFATPLAAPANVAGPYGANVVTPLVAVATPYGAGALGPATAVPEGRWPALGGATALLAGLALAWRRRPSR